MEAIPAADGDATAHPTVAPVQGAEGRHVLRPTNGSEVTTGVTAGRSPNPSPSLTSTATVRTEEEGSEVDRRPILTAVTGGAEPLVKGDEDRLTGAATDGVAPDVAGQGGHAGRLPFRD